MNCSNRKSLWLLYTDTHHDTSSEARPSKRSIDDQVFDHHTRLPYGLSPATYPSQPIRYSILHVLSQHGAASRGWVDWHCDSDGGNYADTMVKFALKGAAILLAQWAVGAQDHMGRGGRVHEAVDGWGADGAGHSASDCDGHEGQESRCVHDDGWCWWSSCESVD